MDFNGENSNFGGVIEELRALRGTLNAKGFGDENPVLVEIATLKIQVHHLDKSIQEIKRALWGIAAGLIALVLKMVVEGSLLK